MTDEVEQGRSRRLGTRHRRPTSERWKQEVVSAVMTMETEPVTTPAVVKMAVAAADGEE
ncbi:hypothetical protein PF010_g1037 [Phytophthora fragariae]|uniref:Uncharacterized protein n=1 Tax=Phytophthora fragariae TaxID=53985 RepID=A0A6A3V693_9STRA|nr:hypothetical protein PF009_g1329 [Phytophthora fragariae]KAE9030064.1 hypothetical protein PF011_g800 [Phytophthora fragariae]KAE9138207.1 hypothetical protein PF010_g1037 [Phytophthora fragariae]KAE9138988.1 hypothetical protein PF007_g1197 [Phytophthora fragariae]KAE9155003.1 hypothetical protein PF006_g1038 [Phytophthora fragariae]